MKSFKHLLMLAIMIPFIAACGSKYKYESVAGDPMNSRIYTLDNGLKVYMTVNKAEPRIQTYIAVRVGGKNDPSETTGLAHYFEHLMFKGSEQFGTSDYAAEKPLLDEIEAKFEKYRTLTDPAEREAMYAQIDSLSLEASKYFIPNEYDKLMAAIGAQGTNAYTGYDMTVYVEDIPSNQIENWAKVQADRFKHNVIRGFHTELETVYEEKNMSLTDDSRKSLEVMFATLFPNHPYGTQTILGTQEHLKNPSITNIKNYYKNWYVPNNMAICISGDFDPDMMIATIDKYFGDMVPNKELKRLEFKKEEPIKEPVVKEVYGLESPNVILAWRFNGMADMQNDTLNVLGNVLFNGRAGVVDLDINQAQRTLGAYAFPYSQADYTAYIMQGFPKQGQTLEQVKEIMLESLEKVKKGDFDEALLTAAINNAKRERMQKLEENAPRADMFVTAFINNIPWAQYVGELDRLSKITKEDVVKFANAHFGNNYVQVNKLEGKDDSVQKISKPKITPIHTNRDKVSAFLAQVQASEVAPIEPVFVDYEKDLTKTKAKSDIEVLYKQNTTNSLFSLTYLFDKGANDSKMLSLAADYIDLLGTDKYSAEELKQQFYNLACDYRITVNDNQTFFNLSGLSENMDQALALFEEFISNCKADEIALAAMKQNIFQARINNKLDQRQNYIRMTAYVQYGPENPFTDIFSNQQIQALTSEQLISEIKDLMDYEHTILYYGPMGAEEFVADINKVHYISETPKDMPQSRQFVQLQTNEDKVFIAPYDAKQIYMISYSNTGEKYDPEKAPIINMYGNYFGGGMNSIVFQEMREARGLAYSANAKYKLAYADKDAPYNYTSFIATQNDKMMDAIRAFDEIINNMPQSEAAFAVAKDNIIASIRTDRILGDRILWNYISAQKMGLTEDSRKLLFEKVQNFTLADIVKFQQEVVKDRKYYIGILGDEKDLDMQSLGNGDYGKIVRLSQKDIFAY
ncbi:MAG: insulinase family protein [Bacteroidales bacterium]|nr:insulinase family protein [Bacteroidales bacterium]